MNSQKLLPDKEALDFIADVLAKESLRFINKCLEEAEESLELYRDIGKIPKKSGFRFADVLALTFFRIKYPIFIDFLLHYFDSSNRSLANYSEVLDRDNFIKGLKKEDSSKLIRYIEYKIGYQLSLKLDDEEIVEKIFSQTFRFWYDAVYSAGLDKSKIGLDSPEARDDVFSNPTVLKRFLKMMVDKESNPVTDGIEIYKNHVKNKETPSNISIPDLINYSRVLRDIKNTAPVLNLDVARAIYERIFKDQTTLQAMGRRDESLRGDAIYQFSFQILEVFEKRSNQQSLNDSETQAIELLKQFLLSSVIDTGSKFLVLSSFANTDRQGSSDINWRLNKAFDVMCKFDNNLIPALQYVFKEFDSRYISGNKILYESEENFRFVLFQAWSGYADNIQEIEGIRKCALRGLNKNIKAIKLYWDQYDYSGVAGWSIDAKDEIIESGAINSDLFEGANIYLPLDELIKISEGIDFEDPILTKKIEFWSILRKEYRTQQWFILHNDLRTLKAVLIQRGFLPDEEILIFKEITKESLEKYTKIKCPNMKISSDYQDKILLVLVNSMKYKRIMDIDKVVQKVAPLISKMFKDYPNLFSFGTDFISKSLGLYDPQFMVAYPFVDTTKQIFKKIRQENPSFFESD